MFESSESWQNPETKRVAHSLKRQIHKAFNHAKDTPFEQELTKRAGKLLSSEGEFARKIAQIRMAIPTTLADNIPLWHAHQIALMLGFELVSDTFGTLMVQNPYYKISRERKESVFIPLFSPEFPHPNKQEVTFWLAHGSTLVYKKEEKGAAL